MVGMGVGDHGAIDGFPRIDVEIAHRAVEAVGPEFKERHYGHYRRLPGSRWSRTRRACQPLQIRSSDQLMAGPRRSLASRAAHVWFTIPGQRRVRQSAIL